MEPDKIASHHGLLRSLMDLAQPNKALVHTAGILAERWYQSPDLCSLVVKCLSISAFITAAHGGFSF